MIRYIFIVVSLVSCTKPVPCNEGLVRQQVIDSLKLVYEKLNEPVKTIANVAKPPKTTTVKAASTGSSKKVTFIDGEDVIYKGNRYPIITGPKGGKYFMAPTTEGAAPTRHSLPKSN